jgi:hypothetical protein
MALLFGAISSAVAERATSWRWLSFLCYEALILKQCRPVRCDQQGDLRLSV